MSAARGIALSALVVAVLLAGYLLLFRGSGGHEYTLVFQTAGQLVKDDDVQVAGRRIGSVRAIKLTDDNLAAVKIEVEEPYAPLREGTRAIVRLTSLSGIANRYVALTLAPDTNKELDDGARLDLSTTTSVVDLDQLFNAIDAKTRGDLQDVIQGFATQYEGKGEEVGQSAKYFNPLLSTSRVLAQQVTEDEGALTRFLVNSSRAVTAVAERRDDLSGLVSNANATAGAIAAENVALSRALELLPTTLRRANTTFVNLRATLDDLDVLVAESKPATKDLAPFLRELRPLVRDARPTIRDLSTLIAAAAPTTTSSRRRARCRRCSGSPRPPSPRAGSRSSAPSRCSSSSGPTRPTSSAGCATSARAPRTTTPTATSRASSRSSTRSSSPTTPPAAC